MVDCKGAKLTSNLKESLEWTLDLKEQSMRCPPTQSLDHCRIVLEDEKRSNIFDEDMKQRAKMVGEGSMQNYFFANVSSCHIFNFGSTDGVEIASIMKKLLDK